MIHDIIERVQPHKSGTAMRETSGAVADSLRKDSISMIKHTTHDSHTQQKLCECGCGQPAPIAKRNRKADGHIKGQPVRFIHGHGNARPLLERFWEKVDKRGPDDCWEWQASTNAAGYGVIGLSGALILAHRLSWKIHNGPIPEGMCACHHCDNPPCVNPKHLWLATHADNMGDRDSKGRVQRGIRNGRAKLTPEKIRHIRTLHEIGASTKGIAARFGVHPGNVRRIVTGKIWRHVK